MLKTITKLFLLVSLLSFLMLILVAILTDTVHYNSLFAFMGYFYITLLAVKFFKDKISTISIVIILLASVFIMQFYTIYLCLVESLFSLPFLLAYCLGIISAFFYLKLKSPFNILPFSLSLVMAIFMVFQGWDYWLHKSNFGTFTGKVTTYNLPTKFESFNENKETIRETNFNNKIVLLDFWTTTCGVCFQKFPQLQAFYERNKQDSSVIILAVDTPLEEDKPNQAFEMIKQRNYTFPVVITKDADLAEKWGITGYPTTFVINPNGQIVYKGNIEGAVKMVDELKSTQ